MGIRIPTSFVAKGAREGPAGPVQTDPHCLTLASGDLVPTTLRVVGTIFSLDTQHSSVTIPASRSDPSQSVQSPDTCMESIQDALCSRGFLVDVISRLSRLHQESNLSIYESKWRIFTAWCNIQHINPLSSATGSVVSDFLLHLHMEKRLAISTIASYQMAIASTLRATSGVEPPFEPLDQASDQVLTWKTAFLIVHASGKRRGEIHAFEHARLQRTCHSYQRRKYWARAQNACFHAQFQHLTVI